jgi:hypothetical protein
MRTGSVQIYGRLVRITVELGVVVVAALLASPAAAEPASFVKFAGAVGEQAQVVAPAGDVNGDGHDDVIIGAPTAPTPRGDYAGAAGAAYVVYGPFVPGTTIELGRLEGNGFVVQGAGGEGTGSSVAGVGDVNGDGLDDVLVGAPRYRAREGRAYVVFGRRRPHPVDLAELGRTGITLHGNRYKRLSDSFGADVAPLGDINGDGLADVGIVAGGESRACRGCFRPGSAYVVFGRRRGGSLSMTRLGRAGFRLGLATQMHEITSAGDWNADGRPDIALTGTARGGARTWIAYGRRHRGTVKLSRLGERGLIIRGPGGVGPGHSAVAGGEDVDGDARPDLVIGTPWTNRGPSAGPMSFGGGGVWVIRGSRPRATVDLRNPGRRAWEIVRGDPARMTFTGDAVALGRIDADGLADVAVTGGGPLAVVFGNASRVPRQLPMLAPDEGFLVPAPVAGGVHGVATAGDLNGDGRTDLLVGAPGVLAPGSLSAGAAYLIFSP